MASIENTFRALADGTRLRILCLLSSGELCVGDLVDLLEVPQPTASRHLAYLRGAGLVDTRREGQWAFYSLTKPTKGFGEKLLALLESCRDEQTELRADARQAAKLRKSGGCCPAKVNSAGVAR
ncbi:MAG: ArsR family transcriptional regulator [Planctomycetota bacterium]|jgi:ArsR family transcriptional regulator